MVQNIKDKPQEIQEKLKWFRNQKFGLMMHWGVYSVRGCCESWPLVKDDEWARGWEWGGAPYEEVRKQYRDLHKYFNPLKFDPDRWAGYAEEAGMKYVVFTTKHHDGFNMYDTKFSEYKVTGPECPFSNHKYADITKEIFKSFRKKEMGIGAYYSKADWYSPYYWNPNWPIDKRTANYDLEENPELWQMYVDFVHGQIKELMAGYGPLDILWFDAGWVDTPREDIDMEGIVSLARNYYSDLLVVDRECGGKFEDYTTPERKIPEEVMDKPWESCLPMGEAFAYSPRDTMRSTRELIHQLVEIVAKGGNLLLNVAPKPDGTFPEEAVDRLQGIGRWMEVNEEAIYDTSVCAPYTQEQMALTRKEDSVYLFYLLSDEEELLPEELLVKDFTDFKVQKIDVLGGRPGLDYSQNSKTLKINIPDQVRYRNQGLPGCVLKMEGE